MRLDPIQRECAEQQPGPGWRRRLDVRYFIDEWQQIVVADKLPNVLF